MRYLSILWELIKNSYIQRDYEHKKMHYEANRFNKEMTSFYANDMKKGEKEYE